MFPDTPGCVTGDGTPGQRPRSRVRRPYSTGTADLDRSSGRRWVLCFIRPFLCTIRQAHRITCGRAHLPQMSGPANGLVNNKQRVLYLKANNDHPKYGTSEAHRPQ
jgi:hypothetical protein